MIDELSRFFGLNRPKARFDGQGSHLERFRLRQSAGATGTGTSGAAPRAAGASPAGVPPRVTTVPLAGSSLLPPGRRPVALPSIPLDHPARRRMEANARQPRPSFPVT